MDKTETKSDAKPATMTDEAVPPVAPARPRVCDLVLCRVQHQGVEYPAVVCGVQGGGLNLHVFVEGASVFYGGVHEQKQAGGYGWRPRD